MKKILLILLVVTLLVVASVAAVVIFTSTNGRSTNPVKNLRQIVAKHDAENFYKLVDVDAVLASAADEILTAQINSQVDALAYSTQDFVKMYDELQPDFVNSAKTALDQYIATGKVNFTPPLTPAQKFFKDSDVDTCTIKSFSKPKTEGDETYLTVELFNDAMKFYFSLELQLQQVDKSTWKIIGAKGFESYYAGFNRALRQKLERLNAPIRDEIAEIFKVKGFSASVAEGDEYGFSRTLQLTIKADVKFDKPLSKIGGNIIIDGKEGREGVTPFSIDMVGREQGEQTFDVDKTLNPFVREDVDVMRHGLRKSAIHIEVTQVDFADGTTLKEYAELPE